MEVAEERFEFEEERQGGGGWCCGVLGNSWESFYFCVIRGQEHQNFRCRSFCGRDLGCGIVQDSYEEQEF